MHPRGKQVYVLQCRKETFCCYSFPQLREIESHLYVFSCVSPARGLSSFVFLLSFFLSSPRFSKEIMIQGPVSSVNKTILVWREMDVCRETRVPREKPGTAVGASVVYLVPLSSAALLRSCACVVVMVPNGHPVFWPGKRGV